MPPRAAGPDPSASLVAAARELARRCDALRFGAPVTHVYDPLAYAWAAHVAYLERYGGRPREVLLLGMNPGPYGMVQTGVPFGDVTMVRDWLRIEAPIARPAREHPERPVRGFACPRAEVSGSRLWGWARERFGTPERFFRRFFVLNYCPLAFLEASGKNRTPDKLPRAEREPLARACDEALRAACATLRPRVVVGVGAYARAAAAHALADLPVRVGTMLHPSPASPRANRGWQAQAEADLRACGVVLDPEDEPR